MRALTLIQPWASAVVAGIKSFETRSWDTPIRGVILIHASKKHNALGSERYMRDPFPWLVRRYEWPVFRELPRGAIIGSVRITGCESTQGLKHRLPAEEIELGNYDVGRYAWSLAEPVAFAEHFPCRGSLGLWSVPEHIERDVERYLGALDQYGVRTAA